MKPFLLFVLLAAFFPVVLPAQQQMTTQEYIERYKGVAIRKMEEFGIPASITLAQGILESGSGNSKLAKKANNHFGIKCHKDWNGRAFHMDDDKRHECFRKYKNPADSYRDHSLFLTQRGRYSFLFDYDISDYRSWAYGLKKAGYATNPKYPQLLIGLIERYHLDQYDKGVSISKRKHRTPFDSISEADENNASFIPPFTSLMKKLKVVETTVSGRNIYENNGVKLIFAQPGDTYYDLADEFEVYSWQLYKYNETDKRHFLKTNEIVYLEKKKRKADKKHKKHIVRSGESLRQVAQLYGIRLSSLMKMNGLEIDKNVPVGTVLTLR